MNRSLTRREKRLLVIAAGGAGLYILLQFIVTPVIRDWQDSRAEYARIRAQYAKTLALARQAEKTYPAGVAPAPGLSDSSGMAGFLREIEQTAGLQIVIHQFQPQGQSPAASRRHGSRRESRAVVRQQVKLECSGQFAELMRFIDQIESQNSHTRVRFMHMMPKKGAPGLLTCQIILVRLTLG